MEQMHFIRVDCGGMIYIQEGDLDVP